MLVRRAGFGVRLPGFETWLLLMGHDCGKILGLSVLICKMGLIKVAASQGYDEKATS